METSVFQNALVAIVLGLIIGLQREMNLFYEHRHTDFAGARTFSLIGLSGYLSALLNQSVPFFLPIMVLVLGALLLGAYILNRTPVETGMTTEFSALVVFLACASLLYTNAMFSVFVIIAMLFILNLKEKIQTYEKVIEKKDLSAAILFLMMSCVVLPLAPDKPIDPWGYINLYHIWMMTVLVAGISFLGYIAVRLVGAKHGIGLAGFLGGIVSSTAVTLSLARRSKEEQSLSKNLALGISLACSIMLFRLLIEIYVINPPLAKNIFIPVCVASVIGYAYVAYLYFSASKETIVQETSFQNPFKLSEALLLGIFFGSVMALITFTDKSFGHSGVYVVSFISGLGDTDAIALSLASLATNGLSLQTASHALLLAVLANSIVKSALVLLIGTKKTFLYVAGYLSMTISSFIATYWAVQ
jgi:uncharacterized membrane protein (DUF4010 family)